MKNKIGRPISFDRESALTAAMHIFWQKGYEGASMKDLTGAMGINSPSLYSAFGDKRNLYLKTIKYYASEKACAPLAVFETEPDIAKATKLFMEAVIEHSVESSYGATGCFLSSSVATSAGDDGDVRKMLKEAIDDTDVRICRRFELEKARGVLVESFPSMERARLLFDMRQGHVFRARAGSSREDLEQDIAARVSMVLDLPQANHILF